MKNCFLLAVIFLLSLESFGQSGSIDLIEKVNLGGIQQTVLIRGKDNSKPVLLLLHGGPGFSEFIFFRTYNRELENDFIVVNWEQRGAGLSFSDSIQPETMNVKQFVSDAHELVGILKTRFQKNKVFLLGHSWGSVIGLKLASLYPQDFYAYVGVGQVVNGIENEKKSLEFTLQKARKDKNAKAVAELEAVAKVYPANDERAINNLIVQRRWLAYYGGVFYGKMNYETLFRNVGKEELTLYDGGAAAKGEAFSMKYLLGEVLRVDFTKTISEVKKNSLFSDEPRSKLTGHSPENNEFLRERTYALSGLQRKPTLQADGEFFSIKRAGLFFLGKKRF